MHSLDERDQREGSQRPEDGVRAVHIYREEHLNMLFVPILGVRDNEKANCRGFQNLLFYVYMLISLCNSCTGMSRPILANDVSCTAVWPSRTGRRFIKANEGGTPVFSGYSPSQLGSTDLSSGPQWFLFLGKGFIEIIWGSGFFTDHTKDGKKCIICRTRSMWHISELHANNCVSNLNY